MLICRVLPHVDCLVPCGTTGEFPYLSVAEQQRLLREEVKFCQIIHETIEANFPQGTMSEPGTADLAIPMA